MTFPHAKQGSALLIVLGFLSFMVVSAVSFAVYMRTERISSSGFHRTASVRQMVKAGLANAISQIDAAIGDDPFPGLGPNSSNGRGWGVDHWSNRVFTPSNYLNSSETVAVLTLEGLSYLPPSLVNEVRAGARNTHSAAWQPMSYDVGRFAYVAVNVSDFFDVNKVRFGAQRSTAPNGHVALSYLFQNRQGTSMEEAAVLPRLDEFLDSRGGSESQVPFVSLADFNVALYKKDPSGSSLGVVSPFYNYLKNGKWRTFYSNDSTSDTDQNYKRAQRMPFVTDSWQIPTNVTDTIDLARDEDQPFRKTAFQNARNMSLLQLETGTGRAYTERLRADLSLTTMANLYDYLDDNSIPLSLGIPNVERVPMVACVNGSTLAGQLSMAVTSTSKDEDYNKGAGASYIRTTTTYKLTPNVAAAPLVPVVTLYPFKGRTQRDGEPAPNFKVQVCAKIFFTRSDGGNGPWSCRCQKATNITPLPSEWNQDNSASFNNNCITLVSAKTNLSVPSEVFEEDDAAIETIVPLPSLSSVKADVENRFLLQTMRLYRKDQTTGMKGTEVTGVDGYPKASTFKLLPFTGTQPRADGHQVVGPANAADAENEVPLDDAKCWGMTLTPHVALWVRVIDGDGKTADLAPASMYDDQLNGGMAGAMVQAVSGIFGDGSAFTPMLGAAGTGLVFNKENRNVTFDGGQDTAQPFQGVAADFVALDPRFNHSPEDFIVQGSSVGKGNYLSMLDNILGQGGHDGDIFMFCSDQEYLQSIGELAFLPQVGQLGDTSNGLYMKCSTPLAPKGSWNELQADAAHNHSWSFWRTYPLYKQRDDGYGPDDYLFRYFGSQVEAGDKTIVYDVNGFKINPYSDLLKIQLAATANTPHSFWASSTNTTSTGKNPPCFQNGEPRSMDECLRHCFNQISGNVGQQLSWNDVTNMTAYVFRQMRDNAYNRVDWETTLANLDWYDEADPGLIFGRNLDGQSDDLHSVDRKTLYSFWHDSLANRQQLFLIFVRVEPTPFGASDILDVVPSQYGARAVALVWRDPYPSSSSAPTVSWRGSGGDGSLFGTSIGTYAPHRTRLLFYHQFD